MYLTIKANEFDQNNILINNKTKNNIMNNSDFFRILYSDDKITFNGIYIHFILENLNIEKYFNKVKCCFQNNIYNNDTINEIIRNSPRTKLFADGVLKLFIYQPLEWIITIMRGRCFQNAFRVAKTPPKIKKGAFLN